MKKAASHIIIIKWLAWLVCMALVHPCTVMGQDPRFTQFFTSPMTLNPALTGKGIADWRALSNYRSQWFGSGINSFTTSTISLEKKMAAGISGTDAFGVGLLLLSESSNAGVLKNNQLAAGLSYSKSFDKESKQVLSGGVSVTYNNRMFDASKMIFESQFSSGGFQSSTVANDAASSSIRSYANINAGLHYSFTAVRSGFYLGASYFHIAAGNDAMTDAVGLTFYPRFSLQTGYQYRFLNGHQLSFSAALDNQAGSTAVTVGGLLKLAITESNINVRSINMGIWDRFGDAVSPYFGIDFHKNWLLGISYDVVTSKVSNTLGSLQTMEMSFGWQFAGKKKAAVMNAVSSVVVY